VGAGDRHLARLARRHLVAVVVEDVELHLGHRVAGRHRALERLGRVEDVEGDDAGLGGAEAVGHPGGVEQVLRDAHRLGIHQLAAQGDHAQVGELTARQGVDQESDHHRGHVGEGDALVGQEVGHGARPTERTSSVARVPPFSSGRNIG
jgi:hypothetical protein